MLGEPEPDKLTITLLERERQHSNYDWLNIDCGSRRVGKARTSIDGTTLTIYSINIFAEFEGRGHASHVIETLKQRFPVVVADRVRPAARGFWEKMGFVDRADGSYEWVGGPPDQSSRD